MTHIWKCIPKLQTQTSFHQGNLKNLSDPTWAYGLLVMVSTKKVSVNKILLRVIIMYNSENMCHTYQLKCHLQKLSYQHCHFAVRTQNLME